jgi:hypothetical protein
MCRRDIIRGKNLKKKNILSSRSLNEDMDVVNCLVIKNPWKYEPKMEYGKYWP